MSSTNKTATIELSQYISTDKPTYLTDYNGDMLKIDNAITSDREGINTAQNKANTADGKADANKTSIDTLNAQINGDPTIPSDTGIAGRVADIGGDVDTIESLIGTGSPTTSNQTIIGAINGLEGAIAPREDGADLANSYAEGEQFARGGSVYTALTSLTAGTAFASLTLNTDYKNSDTLVKQIKEAIDGATAAGTSYDNTGSGLTADNVQEAIDEVVDMIPAGYLLTTTNVNPEVTADGVKTYKELLTDLFALVNTTQAAEEYDAFILAWISVDGKLGCNATGLRPYGRSATTTFQLITSDTTSVTTAHIDFKETTSTYHEITATASGNTFTDKTNAVPANGIKISVRMYKCVPQNIS